MQRAFDVFFCCVAIALLAPVFVIVMVILRFTGEGDVFYRQDRIGLGGRRFQLLKFATMLRNSPSLGACDITLKNDPRILRFGRILRKTKINEFPQLLNILLGDMSLVGPRPMVPKTFDKYPEKSKAFITSVRPGLTGVGSVFFRDEERYLGSSKNANEFYESVIIPYKAELECWYVSRVSIRFYLKLIFLTCWVVLFPKSRILYSGFKGMPPIPQALRVLNE